MRAPVLVLGRPDQRRLLLLSLCRSLPNKPDVPLPHLPERPRKRAHGSRHLPLALLGWWLAVIVLLPIAIVLAIPLMVTLSLLAFLVRRADRHDGAPDEYVL